MNQLHSVFQRYGKWPTERTSILCFCTQIVEHLNPSSKYLYVLFLCFTLLFPSQFDTFSLFRYFPLFHYFNAFLEILNSNKCQKKCKIWRIEATHIILQRLKQQAEGQHGSASGRLCMCLMFLRYSFLSELIVLWFLCLCLTFFFFYWFALSSLSVIILLYILFYFIIFGCYLLKACFYLMKARKDLIWKEREV